MKSQRTKLGRTKKYGENSRRWSPVILSAVCIIMSTYVFFRYPEITAEENSGSKIDLGGIRGSKNKEGAKKLSETVSIVKQEGEKEDGAIVGSKGGAWTAETHLRSYGFNVDWGLMEVLESSCREIEDSRIPSDEDKWHQYKNPDPFHPLINVWIAPQKKYINCKVLEVGCGVGVYVDGLKKEDVKRGRTVIGIEPNPMGGIFERGRAGPKQLPINFLDGNLESIVELTKNISQEHLNGEKFDLIYSIEVFEHMPLDRHEDAVQFLAGLARKGTKLIFGAGKPGQSGIGHIGGRRANDWINIMAKYGFIQDKEKTRDAVQTMQEYNHRVNSVVYIYNGGP